MTGQLEQGKYEPFAHHRLQDPIQAACQTLPGNCHLDFGGGQRAYILKRPSFQFYPGDWLRDTALRTCSVGARGLWIDMICLMHEGSVYGYLKVGNKVILPNNLARMVGATLHEIEGWLSELNEAAVFSKDADGCIFSRRMIRDEEIRESRAAGGVKGGNPSLLSGSGRLTSKDNQKPTPSSSSSPSSSSASTPSSSTPKPGKSKTIAPLALLASLGIIDPIASDWITLRKTKKAAITETALKGIQREADKAGISLQDALRVCCERGWAGFKAEWMNGKSAGRDLEAERRAFVGEGEVIEGESKHVG